MSRPGHFTYGDFPNRYIKLTKILNGIDCFLISLSFYRPYKPQRSAARGGPRYRFLWPKSWIDVAPSYCPTSRPCGVGYRSLSFGSISGPAPPLLAISVTIPFIAFVRSFSTLTAWLTWRFPGHFLHRFRGGGVLGAGRCGKVANGHLFGWAMRSLENVDHFRSHKRDVE